jgi:hypothetical protein
MERAYATVSSRPCVQGSGEISYKRCSAMSRSDEATMLQARSIQQQSEAMLLNSFYTNSGIFPLKSSIRYP